nr:SDR family NAD(P)-dependent oxidoreductase [Oceanococcus sp. HetDA_MAG_MS8]
MTDRPADSDLTGQRILLTGASSGIGYECARQLAALGAEMILVARREAELDALARHIRQTGGTAHCLPVDLSDLQAVDALSDEVIKRFGEVDILINNAGRSIRRSIQDSLNRPHDFERTMTLNYHAAVRLCLKLLPGMLERDRGQIINVSSQSVQMPTPRFSAYVGSKAALEGFSRSLACELEATGVHITIVNYPLVRTPMSGATPIYRALPMMEVEEAASWMLKAVRQKPARVCAASGHAWQVSTALAPGLTTRLTARFLRHMLKRLQAKHGA